MDLSCDLVSTLSGRKLIGIKNLNMSIPLFFLMKWTFPGWLDWRVCILSGRITQVCALLTEAPVDTISLNSHTTRTIVIQYN